MREKNKTEQRALVNVQRIGDDRLINDKHVA